MSRTTRIALYVSAALCGANHLAAQSANLSLSGITPNSGLAGTSVDIVATGSGFAAPIVGTASLLPGATLLWRRNNVDTPLATTFVSTSTLRATIPASLMTGAPATVQILVENRTGCTTCLRSNTQSFDILSPLQLTQLQPDRGAPGTAVGLTAIGSGFSNGRISTSVLIWRRNGVETRLSTQVVSATTLTTTIPASLMVGSGTADILVENGGPNLCDGPCPRSNSLTFTILPLVLTSLNPNRAPTRTASGVAQDFTLFGQGFAPNAQVFWQASSTSAAVELRVTSRTGSTQMDAQIPASLLTQPLVASVFVRNPGTLEFASVDSNALPFTVFVALELTRIDPVSVAAGSAATKITAFGSGFTTNTRIAFRDSGGTRTPAGQVVNVTAGTIELTAGPELLVTPKVWEVVALDGPTTSEPLRFEVTSGIVISSLSPATRAAASGTFDLTINGSGFGEGAVVLFGDQTLTPASRTLTQIRVSVTAPATAQRVDVRVRVGTVTSNTVTFAFTAPGPVITSLSPSSRTVNSGDFNMTITGQNFLPSPSVTFGGQAVTIVGTPTATSIVVQISNARLQQTGSLAVVVRVNGIDSDPSAFQISPVAAPAITSLSPSSRPANSGDFDLTITGQNFLPAPTVTFGGQAVTIVGTPTATEIVVRIPNVRIQQAGDAQVVVRVNGVDSRPATFTVSVGGPVISALNPASRAAGSGDFTLTITGQNLGPNPAVTFDDQPVTTVGTASATSIQVTVTNAMIQTVKTARVQVQVGTQSASANFAITAPQVPAASVTTAAGNVAPGGNTTAAVTLSGAAPVPMTGTLELTFAPNAAGLGAGFIDPALVFVSGGTRRLAFTIGAGQNAASIPGNGAFNVGTVAGTVTLTVTDLKAAGVDVRPPDPRTVTIPRTAPSIQAGSARLTNSTGGVTVELQGSSSGRDITQAAVTFTFASGANVTGGSTFTVALQQAFTAWFTSDAGRNNGSRFLLQIPFTVPEGDPNQITGFSITLTGPDGNSAAVTGGR